MSAIRHLLREISNPPATYYDTSVISAILKKIFGPVNIDNVWRIRKNMEIDKLIEGADIVRFIKAQRIKWTKQDQLGSY